MTEEFSNNLRVDLYKHLFPRIIQEDQRTGIDGFVNFWDDPCKKWDDKDFFWDEIGLVPIIQNLFFAIETEEGKDLEIIDSIKDLVNPDKCPEKFLDVMAASLGHPLEADLTEQKKREEIKGLFDIYKTRGREISWEVFYRLLGFKSEVIPLFKKDIFEENDNYSQSEFIVEAIIDEQIGIAGTNYVGKTDNKPIKPGTFFVSYDGGKKMRDQGNRFSDDFGKLISTDGSTGTINYATGKYSITLAAPTTLDVFVSYGHIIGEFPYKAARIDLEIFLMPDSEGHFSVEINDILIQKFLEVAEEVRPIHVVLRAFIIVIDFTGAAGDELLDVVSDAKFCGPLAGIDRRDAEQRFYAADMVDLGIPEDYVLIEQLGATIDKNLLLEDKACLITFPDNLTLEFSDGRPDEYW